MVRVRGGLSRLSSCRVTSQRNWTETPSLPSTCCLILLGLQQQLSEVDKPPLTLSRLLLNKCVASSENGICFLDSLLSTVSKFGNVSRILKQ